LGEFSFDVVLLQMSKETVICMYTTTFRGSSNSRYKELESAQWGPLGIPIPYNMPAQLLCRAGNFSKLWYVGNTKINAYKEEWTIILLIKRVALPAYFSMGLHHVLLEYTDNKRKYL
jgi:hypothetical protein